MRLPKNHTRVSLVVFGVIISALTFATVFKQITKNTFAEEENGSYHVSESHFVTFYDQGKKHTVKTSAETVGEALTQAGYTLDASDKIEPSLATKINMDNFYINIYRARPVTIIDGRTKKYYMTASYDEKTIAEEAGFSVYDGDEISLVENTDFLETGASTVYKIIRNGGQTATSEINLPYDEQVIKDYSMPVGENKVEQVGEDGLRVVKYKVEFKDGVEVSREVISDEVVREPVKRIVKEGARSASAGATTSASENEQITWQFLTSNGFSAEQAAGIMGNLQQEHHFQTSDTAGGLGIAQWTGGRRTNLLSRDNPYDIYTQLQFLLDELNTGYSRAKSAITSSSSIEESTRAFQNQFERCGICREELRINYAYDIYGKYAK